MNKEKHNCNDCIHSEVCEWVVDCEFICSDFIDKKALERPQGEWLITWESDEFVCKECKSNVKQPTMMGKPAFKFCPNCGAIMET